MHDGPGVAQPAPQLLRHVRRQRCDQQHQSLGDRARQRPARLRQVVVQLRDLGDRGVEPHPRHVLADTVDGLVQRPQGVLGGLRVHDGDLTGLLVDDVAPQPLQQPELTDHGPGVPGTRDVQRAHGHLVQPQGVRAVLAADLVGRHGVLQGLAHLAQDAADLLAGVVVRPVALLDLGGRDRDTAAVPVDEGLDHALVVQLVERLGGRDVPQVVQHLRPEACVQQVQHGVLRAADVQVDAAGGLSLARAHPVLLDLRVDQLLGVVRVQVAQLVPAGTGPVGHGVGLAAVLLRAVAQVQGDVDPVGVPGQRGLGLGVGVLRVEGARRVVLDLGQLQRQHRLGQRVGDALLVVHDREGLTPVALAAEQPVTQPEVDGALADAVRLQPLGDLRLGVDDAQAVQRDLVVGGVDQLRLVRGEGVVPRGGVGPTVVRRLDDTAHRQLEGAREREVARVVRRYGHDRAGAVSHQDVVGNEDGHLLAADRVGRVRAGEDAGLVLGLRLPLHVGLGRGLLAVRGDGLGRVRVAAGPHRMGAFGPGGGDDPLDQLVLGRQHHVRRAEQGVLPGGEDGDVTGPVHREVDARALGTADPVALLQLDGLGPVQPVQVVQQPVRVGGDAHVPLTQLGLEDREVAALGAAVGRDLFVGQHGAQPGRPVDRCVRGVRQAVLPQDVGALGGAQRAPLAAAGNRPLTALELLDQFGDRAGPVGLGVVPGVEDLQEDPLGPPVVLRVDRRERAALVVPQAQPAQLDLHVLHVGLGGGPRVRARLHGVLLGGQAEGVEAQGVQDVVPGHPLVAGVDVGGDVAQRVTDMQAGPRGVREHVHDELLRLGGQLRVACQVTGRIRCLVRPLGVPEVLPACLDVGGHRCRIAVRRGHLGRGVRLAHDSQSSIDRHLPAPTSTDTRLRKRKIPSHRRGRRAESDQAFSPVGNDQRGSLSRRRTARMASGYRTGPAPGPAHTAPWSSCGPGTSTPGRHAIRANLPHDPHTPGVTPRTAPYRGNSSNLVPAGKRRPSMRQRDRFAEPFGVAPHEPSSQDPFVPLPE
ncbi:hypothetical protein EES40_16160 [Streptomyces sp. ADI93-02]|nr:hypothetical protein EES40_16160 [Streptomyces sp. ADI93-02]